SLVVAMAPTLVTDCRPSVSSPASPIHTAEHQCGVSSAETEAVRHHCVNGHVILTFTRDRHVGNRRIDGLDIGGFANEAVVHHEQRIDRLMHAGGAERMAGYRLGGAGRRAPFPPYFP